MLQTILNRDGQGTGRDSPANFCPGPACPTGQSCGTVPRKFVPVPLVPQTSVPVPVPRDTKSPGQKATGHKKSRDNRPSLFKNAKLLST